MRIVNSLKSRQGWIWLAVVALFFFLAGQDMFEAQELAEISNEETKEDQIMMQSPTNADDSTSGDGVVKGSDEDYEDDNESQEEHNESEDKKLKDSIKDSLESDDEDDGNSEDEDSNDAAPDSDQSQDESKDSDED